MSVLERYQRFITQLPLLTPLLPNSLNAKLVFWGIPPVVAIILLTGFIAHTVSHRFIGLALERSVKLQTRAMARELELDLAQYRRDLLFLAQNPEDRTRYGEFLARMARSGSAAYRAVGFVSRSDGDHFFWVAEQGRIVQIEPSAMAQLRPDPFTLMDRFQQLGDGEVWLSPINEASYVFPTADNPNRKILANVIVLVTPLWPENGRSAGYVLLAVELSRLRDILSLYNSEQSPIWSYPRTPEIRYGYLFDLDGWILFQSGDPDKPEATFSTCQARAGLEGTLGRPDLPEAFRPAARYGYFWKMVREIRDGHFGIKGPEEHGDLPAGQKAHYLAYSPIRFFASPEKPPTVYAGLAYVDVSRLPMVAGDRQVDVIFLVSLTSAILVALLLYILARTITGPILRLAREVQAIPETGRLEPIVLPTRGLELETLKGAINRMVATLKAQLEEIRLKDRAIASAQMTQVAWQIEASEPEPVDDPLPRLVGGGPLLDRLKKEILKAAEVEADVLVLGETGTGKELTAEAIHRLSSRRDRPFLAINCGALDENLLLDTLFGHTRGAFTEARAERKGAFLEAEGGTLFLDEIQAASPRVQQALLRALAARRIKPLGSDREVPVDVRIIAASNVDLKALIEEDRFREDLYFRLKVLTLHTPALRDHRENIEILARHFLSDIGQRREGPGLVLSRGALEKLRRYPWPGNVRELAHCLLRAAVMADSSVIQADDLQIDAIVGTWPDNEVDPGSDAVPMAPFSAPPTVSAKPAEAEKNPVVRLNSRQRKAMAVLGTSDAFSRSDYQKAAGDLPPRTAVHDLSDLVRKGLLGRIGKGPATRYVWTGHGSMPVGNGGEVR
ncbi:MAG: sigma 54-interacting transcriptional regulator [Desulfobacteraceae bacterium]|jgi:DNA-binding NtrC family response regulator|nr:sigma 54-interacting transcriptional regulator [Desulfobacteraceae bacterium]